jgi:hypothetical protein
VAGLATCPVTHLTEVAVARELIKSLMDHRGDHSPKFCDSGVDGDGNARCEYTTIADRRRY